MIRQLTSYQREALDFSSNILLTANAGSGKTFVLSKRFVEILVNENTELDSIVAITFTDKAAGELNRRIANEIDNRIAEETDIRKQKKLESVRRQLVSANISTIHSFCINILREFSPEAGIDANFIPIDQFTSDELIELCVGETINNLINNPLYEAKLKYLIRLFASKQIVQKHLIDAVAQRRIIDVHLKDLYSRSENEIAEYFQNKFEEIFKILFGPSIEFALKDIKTINSFVLSVSTNTDIANEIAKQITGYNKAKPLNENLRLLKSIDSQLFTQKGEIKNRGYLSKKRDEYTEQIKNVENVFNSLRPFLQITDIDAASFELAHFGKNFIDIYDYTANLYLEKKHQKGYLDFEDMLLFTQKVLQLEDVREYLRNKFKYIMIDEYQDTNELQYQIFMPILDFLKKGNLFVVGDEKQSIYMFRHADLEVFNRTRDDIQKNKPEGKLLNLPHSFRMSPALVLFTNKLFSKLFENPEPLLNEVAYSGLICAKPDDEKGRVEFLLADKEKEISEAEFVANKVIEITSSGEVELKEIGILCRKRNLFEELEASFVKKNIPYSIVGGKGFYQRQTIYDIYNYLSFLLNKDDDAALIGILRAPFYTLSDLEIMDISLEEGKNFFDKLEKKALVRNELQKIVDQLKEHLRIAFSAEVYSLIRTILLETGYWAVVASKKNAKQEIANLEKLLMIARSFSQKSFKSLYDFIVYLKNSIETTEDEGQAQVNADENTVKLLTIHQSKGLEYKAVFLYGCNGYAQEDTVKTKGLSIDKNIGILTRVPLNNNYFEKYSSVPVVELYNYINHKKNLAEVKRLLYVAVTRAMNYLFISATHKDYNVQKDSFFQLFSVGLGLDFTQNELTIVDQVKFMKAEENEYGFYDKIVQLNILLQKEIRDAKETLSQTEEKIVDKRNLVQTIHDISKKEIISATKISMFTQCPIKYELTYELGYSTIYDLIKKYKNLYEFNSKEDDEIKSFADAKGRVIHAILKENIDVNLLEENIGRFLEKETIDDSDVLASLRKKIIDDLKLFYESNSYKELVRAKDYKNELEVYCEEGEHYLYGIIDKLIFESDRLIIIDYKTDDITAEQIERRANDYFAQLKFYAYILSKLYPQNSLFDLKLVFIKHPDEINSKLINRGELISYKEEINNSIKKITSGNYLPNTAHCSQCHFAYEGDKCIKLFS